MKRGAAQDLGALGYKELEHAGFRWLVTEEGASFIAGIEDWSLQGLAAREGWKSRKKAYHMIYVARERGGPSYLVKSYPPKPSRARFFARGTNRARKEFCNTVGSFKIGIRTVLPVAVGEQTRETRWGVIVYPYLEDAASLANLYLRRAAAPLTVRDRQHAERTAGAMLRDFVEKGMFAYDLSLDQFLAQRTPAGETLVYWVDLERVKRRWFFRKESGLRSLGKLLAQMESGRQSGYSINRSSMIRIARGYFGNAAPGRLDRNLCRLAIRAAQASWRQRRLKAERRNPGTSIG